MRQRLRIALIAAVGAGLTAVPATVHGTPQAAYEEQVREGVATLKKGDWEQAVELFDSGRRAAREAGDTRGEANFYFYLGLTHQQQAQTMESGADRNRVLDRAAAYYERALGLRPDSGATLNNLAKLHAERGENEKAAELYQRAVALDDDRAALYAKNYAEQLETTQGWQAAAIYYKRALEARPDDLAAHRGLARQYIGRGSERLLDYLWEAEGRGLLERVQESALDALDSGNFPTAAKRELLKILVVTLARQYYDPKGFPETMVGRRLGRHAEDAGLAAGVEDLYEIHRGESFERSDYRWWADDWSQRKEALPAGVEAFGRLARALGERYRRGSEPSTLALAEGYFRLALELDERRADPEALLRLSDLYFELGRPEMVEQLSKEYEHRLFESKGVAYRRGDWENIYAYHRALGVMYSRLGRTGDEHTPDSAIFQLEHARRAAARLREAQPEAAPVLVETGLIDLLAQAYEAVDRDERSVEVRLEAAELYVEAGREDDARTVLEVLEREPEAPAVRKHEVRYHRVVEDSRETREQPPR